MHFKMEFRLIALMMLYLLTLCLAGNNSSETHRSGRQKRGLVKMMMHIMWDPVRLIRYWYAYDVTKEIAKSWRKIIPTIMLLPITSQMPDTPGVSKYVNPPLKASSSHSVVKDFVYPDLPYGEGHQKHFISKDLYHGVTFQGQDAQDSHKNSVHLVPEYFQSLYPGHFNAETQGSITQFNSQPFGNGQAYESINGNQAKLQHAFYGQQLTASDQHAFLSENNANGHHLVLHQSPKSASKHHLLNPLKTSGTEHHKGIDGQYVFIQDDLGNGHINRKENTAHHAIFQAPSGGFQFVENPMKSRGHQSNLNDAHKGLHLVFHPLAKNHKSHSSGDDAQMAPLLPINLFRNGSAEGHLQAIPIILPNFGHLAAPNDVRSTQINDNKRREQTIEVFQGTSNDVIPTVDPESTVDTNSTKWKHVNRSLDSVPSKAATRNIWVKKRNPNAKTRRKHKETVQHLTDHEQTPVRTNSSNARNKTNRNRQNKSNNGRKGSHSPYTESPPIPQKLMNRQNINMEKLREDLKHGTPVLIPFDDEHKNAQPSRYTERTPQFSNSKKRNSASNFPRSKSKHEPNSQESKRQDVGGQTFATQTFPNEQSADIPSHHSDLSKSKDRVMLFMTRQKL